MAGIYIHIGPMPIDLLSQISKLFPVNAVMDSDLARMVGASVVVGEKADLESLKARLRPGALQEMQLRYPDQSQQAIQWLSSGERGISSNFLFSTVTGVDAMAGRNSQRDNHPWDCADLRRCLLLLEAVPEVASAFRTKMPATGDVWRRLVDNWEAIAQSMERECPDWRKGLSGTLPLTDSMMSSIVRGGATTVCRQCGSAVFQGQSPQGRGCAPEGGPAQPNPVLQCPECGHSVPGKS